MRSTDSTKKKKPETEGIIEKEKKSKKKKVE